MAHWAGLLFILWAPRKKINISTHTQFACWHFVEPKHEIVIRKAVDKEKKQNHIVYTIYIISIGSRNSASDLIMILYSYTNAIDIFSRFLSIVFQLASRTGFAAARRTRLEFIQWAARLICVNSKFTRSVHKMAADLLLWCSGALCALFMRPTHANCGLKLRRAEEATWDQCTRNASWSYVEGKEVRGRVRGTRGGCSGF